MGIAAMLPSLWVSPHVFLLRGITVSYHATILKGIAVMMHYLWALPLCYPAYLHPYLLTCGYCCYSILLAGIAVSCYEGNIRKDIAVMLTYLPQGSASMLPYLWLLPLWYHIYGYCRSFLCYLSSSRCLTNLWALPLCYLRCLERQ